MDGTRDSFDLSSLEYSHSSASHYPISSNFCHGSSFAPRPASSSRAVPPITRLPMKISVPSPSPCTSFQSSSLASLPITAPLSLDISGTSSPFDGAVTPPTRYLPPSPPSSSLVKQAQILPPPPSADSIFSQLSRHVLAQRQPLRQSSSEIEIYHVSLSNFQAFLNKHREAPILKKIKLEYDALSCRIIMCPPPLPYHDCTPVFLQSALFALRSTAFDTDARQRSLSVREIAFCSRDGSYLVPDAAVVVLPVGAPPRVWPTIVVEVANSQRYSDVLAKVKRWFAKSHGMVEVALVLKFTAVDPVLDPACFLELWRCGPRAPDMPEEDGMALEWESDISDGGERTDSDHESLASDELNDVDSASASLSDLSRSMCDQQDQPAHEDPLDVDGSDSSLSTINDDVDEPDILSVDMDTATLRDIDSNSSLRPYLDDEADTPTTYEDQDTTSSTSSGSTSAYHPAPRRHKLQIYLSGARKTVLPVAQPPDPDMRYLSLRYSDFFGSENIPEGRDGGEEVRLDLDELRMQITLLMGLTKDMEGLAKKRRGAGSEGSGKRARS